MVTPLVSVSGIPENIRRIEMLSSERALMVGTGEIMLELKRAAKDESSGPARWQGGQNIPRGGGPGIVTGTHRAGIEVEGPTISGKTATGYVVAKARHSRFLEEGTSRMPAYPFFAPAIATVAPKAAGIFLTHWLKAIGGSDA